MPPFRSYRTVCLILTVQKTGDNFLLRTGVLKFLYPSLITGYRSLDHFLLITDSIAKVCAFLSPELTLHFQTCKYTLLVPDIVYTQCSFNAYPRRLHRRSNRSTHFPVQYHMKCQSLCYRFLGRSQVIT